MRRRAAEIAEWKVPWAVWTFRRPRQSKMAVRVDVEESRCDGHHHKVPVSAQHVNAVAIEVMFTDKYGGEVYAEFVGKVE